jgi:hypothetical protein
VKNTNYLIQKIFELENVNPWEVLYYGLKNYFIDPLFIIDYCYTLVEQTNSKDLFVLDIAALSNMKDIPKMISEKIGNDEDIMVAHREHYNKIWAYLSLAADMCADKIIK